MKDLEKCCVERRVVAKRFQKASSSAPWIVVGGKVGGGGILMKMSHAFEVESQ
jgi:hypothetical protein